MMTLAADGGVLGIIPARGGSKRLPGKNIVEFQGRPIIAYTVQAARDSGLFARLLVTTEDPAIAAVAEGLGVEVEARDPSLATDTARLTEVCLAVLEAEAQDGRHYRSFACLLATAPLRGANDIEATFRLLEPPACRFAMAVTRYGLPPHQALRRQADGGLAPMWPELVNLRVQDAPDLVVDNGSTYFAEVEAFRAHRTFYGPGLRGHLMPRERSVDIDEAVDLELARFWARRPVP